MGVFSSRERREPTACEYAELSSTTRFDIAALTILHKKYETIANLLVADRVIDVRELQAALGLVSFEFTQHIFRAFDIDGSLRLDFAEFVRGLDAMSPYATIEQRAAFCFRVYDIDGTATMLGPQITYEMTHCHSDLSPRDLFIDSPPESPGSFFPAWKAEINGERPRMSLSFPGPKKIAAVEIINPASDEDEPINYGVKAATICLDGRNVWAGRLASRNLARTGSKLQRGNSTFVFFLQNPEIRAMIRGLQKRRSY
jgi:Ca2+-binding EF-hand superfamily protein